MSVGAVVAATSGPSRQITSWPPSPRAPLPPPPGITAQQPPAPEASCWADEPYDASLPFTPPAQPEIDFHRGNFCGVRVPGFTEGGNDKDPSLVITWDLPRYSERGRQQVAQWYTQGCGYTHPVLSVPQTKNQGKTLDDLQYACAAFRSAGPSFTIVNAMGGDGQWQAEWAANQPWLQSLHDAGLLDIVCVAWQIDKWYQADLVDVTLAVSSWAKARGLKVAQHWLNGACALWPFPPYGIENRFDYARFMADKVDYQYMQQDVNASLPALQSAAAKILQSYVGLPTRLVGAELDAQAEYDDPLRRLERYGDQKGFYVTCARWPGRVMDGGYLNGGRNDDGRVL